MAVHADNNKKGEKMNEQNRVLSRANARELTQKEMDSVSGGFLTFSRCTGRSFS